MSKLLVDARKAGCAVVCSAGNDSTDRPAFPAALWNWPGAEFHVDDPADVAPHLSVGALNPNGSVALFSNIGGWVSAYALGVSVVSTSPRMVGGVQSGSRDDRHDLRRESLDPDDFSGGFALWSGSSFAAPLVAGRLAQRICGGLLDGSADDGAGERARVLREAAVEVETRLDDDMLR